ncbi:1-aminocyclopropane-1-carboxylate deaminase [Micromonospora pattaloongensis]|uniref:1-aminocyclopropane-1-carboxylate deaminase n=1 Tax=Micromonospora pattaloongensis TaxID=405436 RepID=A0A1H3H2D0_9ACTN|nr:pyridoxal-phosphate dependent enzyme [Micromonospora pattaloongensis]SDY09743.1 1-aminocyclopropane-1-carboxylate deaminase [Micromonospora pattaloongensis]
MHELTLSLPSPLEELADDRLASHGVRVLLKRDDLIHPDVPGNKWRKLKYNLQAAREQGHRVLLTFGGAYSNHIRAVAAAGYYFGFSTIGVIRGEEHLPLNPSLAYAEQRGMRLTYVDRTTYRMKHDQAVTDALRDQFGDFYLVPEGGSNALALRGCAELVGEINTDFDVICCAAGTGGTLAGIAVGLPPGKQAVGFSALKGGDFLADDVRRLQHDYGRETSNWSVETGFHFGGFARRTNDLDNFINDFSRRHKIQLDRVYVGKMMFGLFSLVALGRFAPGTVVVVVITG